MSDIIREYTRTEGSAFRFWSIVADGLLVHTKWGRIGTTGQQKTKKFSSIGGARLYSDRMVATKVKGGYIRVGPLEEITTLGEGYLVSIEARHEAIVAEAERINARNDARERVNQRRMNARIEESARRTMVEAAARWEANRKTLDAIPRNEWDEGLSRIRKNTQGSIGARAADPDPWVNDGPGPWKIISEMSTKQLEALIAKRKEQADYVRSPDDGVEVQPKPKRLITLDDED